MLRFLTYRFGRGLKAKRITISAMQAESIRGNWNLQISVEDFTQASLEPGTCDRIHSMGAWEHIRPEEIGPLLHKLFEALKLGGRMVHQYTLLRPGTPATYLLGQLIFCGFKLLTLEEQVGATTKAGFV
jgi:cyclopropane-fatty-acyl-phospholipid synthase